MPFQFSEKDANKHRPAIVLSTDAFHRGRADLIVAACTSRIRNPLLPGDYLIRDWSESGLPRPSVATSILRTLKQQMVVMKFGSLGLRDLASFESALRLATGL